MVTKVVKGVIVNEGRDRECGPDCKKLQRALRMAYKCEQKGGKGTYVKNMRIINIHYDTLALQISLKQCNCS